MKTSSDDLFRLIKSLNKSEKGYFKKFAAKNASGSKQNYLILFDAIDVMENYDEEFLKKKLKNEPVLNQLAVYKVYLFNLILKSLHQYGAYDNAESKLTEMLLNAKILMARHLYKEASKILKKAKSMAEKYDKMKFMFEILSAERHIAMQMPQKNSFQQRGEIYSEQRKLHEKIGNFYEYSWLCDQVTILVDNEASHHSQEISERLEKIISSKYLADETITIGYYSLMNFYHAHLVYSGSRNDTEKIFYYLKKNIQIAEANKHFIDESPQNYVFDLINYMLYCNYTNNHSEGALTLEKIKAVRQRLKNKIPLETEIQIFYHASNIEMIIYERTGDMKNGRLKAKQIEKDLAEYKKDVPLNIKAILLNNLACFYFIDGDWQSALKNVNLILNDNSLAIRNDAFEFAKIFQLLIHFELKNYDLLEYLTQSAVKFFKAKFRNYSKRPEKILLNFFSTIVKEAEDSQMELFRELAFNLEKYEKENSISVNDYFDYSAWITGKLTKTPLAEVIKTQNSQ